MENKQGPPQKPSRPMPIRPNSPLNSNGTGSISPKPPVAPRPIPPAIKQQPKPPFTMPSSPVSNPQRPPVVTPKAPPVKSANNISKAPIKQIQNENGTQPVIQKPLPIKPGMPPKGGPSNKASFPQSALNTKPNTDGKLFPKAKPIVKKVEKKKPQKGIDLNEIDIKNQDVVAEDEKKQKKRKYRVLWLLVLLLLLNGGGLVAYEIIKEDKAFVPKTFYDNVSIRLSEFEIANRTSLMANSEINIGEGVSVIVPDGLSDQTMYDILAFAIKVDIQYQKPTETNKTSCNDLISIKFANSDMIYNYDSFGSTVDGYITVDEDQYVYYNQILQPGDEYSIIDKIKVSPSVSNEFAKNAIHINVQVFAVYPRRDKIKEESDSYLKDAPEEWVGIVANKGSEILIERGFSLDDLENEEDEN